MFTCIFYPYVGMYDSAHFMFICEMVLLLSLSTDDFILIIFVVKIYMQQKVCKYGWEVVYVYMMF